MSPTHALDAVKNTDGYKLDKQHTFRVNLFTDFDKWVQFYPHNFLKNTYLRGTRDWLYCTFRYMTISDEWEIPEKQPFKDLVSIQKTEWHVEIAPDIPQDKTLLAEQEKQTSP